MATVSIVTPSFCSSQFVGKTISSLLAQTFLDWELLIVDDNSSDDSVDVIEAFAEKDDRIKLIQLSQNSGAAVARNTAIEAAKGRYIAFLDSDDIWLPCKLEIQLAFMQENDIAFSYASYEKIDESDQLLGVVGVPDKVSYHQLLKCCVIGCLTAMYDTHKLGKVYMPLIRKRQDVGLWLRLLRKVDYAYGVQQPLAQYRIRSGSISHNKKSAAVYNWMLYREVEELSFLKSSYYFGHYAFNGVLRTKFPKLARFLGILK